METRAPAIKAENANWSFGGNVPKNFDEHVKKSVPFYEAGHDLVGKISDYFLSDGSYCYELGCSTAKLTKNLAGLDCRIIFTKQGGLKINEPSNK